ncbi:efflux RND transporter periplasmic adaptor subunit [Vibrio sp. T187]|uniref:efflux RND transporter periplasmic adaptor subunit n=1 Tax=Vibrio TaxID=662 RepID=UPI0010C9A37B|nr:MULTISPECIES: efflux RND transporter periplasmic adaptor subunit [Vibrio]MBW3695913.1 efflux RND transporter periplasmic adaptor subunit [Vibrio sp. T187]
MKLNKITLAVTLLAGSSIFATVAFNGAQMAPASTSASESTANEQISPVQVQPKVDEQSVISQLQQVAVINTQLGDYQAEVVGYGEAAPRYELMLATEVSGHVETISGKFESGQVVKKGEVIATIDATSYQQAVTLAKANLAQAQLDLLEEQRQGEQAKSEWQRSGLSGEPDSPLVLRKPQLAQVTAALENAQLDLKKAQQDLEKTQVTAPFDALVVTRDVQPGSYVQTGTQVATLYSIDEVEILIPLSESQWSSLPSFDNEQLKNTPWPVTLKSSDGTHQWQGYVERIEQHLSQETRQRSLVVVVDQPLEQSVDLYPGTFVTASISGKQLEQLWQLPSSALSQQGELWFVDQQGLLTNTKADTVFEKDGYIYVSPSVDVSPNQTISSNTLEGHSAQVVKRPLSSFQSGMKVLPKVEG